MTTHKAAMAVAMLGLLVAGPMTAHAAPVRTSQGASVTVPAGGYVNCTVTVDNRWPVDLTVTLQDGNGAAVPAEFGSSFVALPESTGTGRYHIESSAGAFGDAQSAATASCKASARGRFEGRVSPVVEVCGCDAAGQCVCK